MGMIPVQVLDGVAAGLLGVATPGLVARILDGGGRFNTGLGAITALVGLGAALSTTLGGLIAKQAGYGAAFIGLASVAVLAFILFAASLPAFQRYASPRPAPA
jgi:predicted MFS family arabinose efflux permease